MFLGIAIAVRKSRQSTTRRHHGRRHAFAVGEHPLAFAERILPILKHVHIKDYTVHPTSSGYRLKRCAIGDGVVNWPEIIALFDREVPHIQGCIELGASVARHIRLLEEDWWATFPSDRSTRR